MPDASIAARTLWTEAGPFGSQPVPCSRVYCTRAGRPVALSKKEFAVLLVMLTSIAGAVALIVTSMNNRRRLREMQHRERLAMIERGLLPSPERDPARFETESGLAPARKTSRGDKYRTAGVAMLGLGFGLMFLVTFAGGGPELGVGIGGAWVMLGAASLLNYFLIVREARHASSGASDFTQWPPARPRQDPPANIAP